MPSPLGPRFNVGTGAVQAVPGCSRKKRLSGQSCSLELQQHFSVWSASPL